MAGLAKLIVVYPSIQHEFKEYTMLGLTFEQMREAAYIGLTMWYRAHSGNDDPHETQARDEKRHHEQQLEVFKSVLLSDIPGIFDPVPQTDTQMPGYTLEQTILARQGNNARHSDFLHVLKESKVKVSLMTFVGGEICTLLFMASH